MPFTNDFIIEPIGEQTFILKEDLKYSNSLLEITVKKDFDFDNGCITVHDGKGGKSRNSLLPTRLFPAIK